MSFLVTFGASMASASKVSTQRRSLRRVGVIGLVIFVGSIRWILLGHVYSPCILNSILLSSMREDDRRRCAARCLRDSAEWTRRVLQGSKTSATSGNQG